MEKYRDSWSKSFANLKDEPSEGDFTVLWDNWSLVADNVAGQLQSATDTTALLKAKAKLDRHPFYPHLDTVLDCKAFFPEIMARVSQSFFQAFRTLLRNLKIPF